MDRGCTIILILLSLSVYGISRGEWIEIDGCHSLRSASVQDQTSLPANEPGGCLQWCGTKTVALQDSKCLCVNGNLTRIREDNCTQNCSGDKNVKCGGNSGDSFSVYRERNDMTADWGSLDGSRCLTYSHTASVVGGQLVPDNCTVRHPFICYSETAYEHRDCYRRVNKNDMTWYQALAACSSSHYPFLWPAQDINSCSSTNIQDGIFWVAVYQWTESPSKPSVTFVPTGTQNIKLMIAIVEGQATGYEIKAVSITSGITYTQKGTFLQNETTSIYRFTTAELPGTCFNFRVVATSGSGTWISSSEPVIEPNVCYGPSRPSVTFEPTVTQNIKLIIAIVEGQATGYEVKAVSITSGITYTQKGTFLQNETTSIYHFTTAELPGTCFNFRVVAKSGSGKWVSSSEPVIEPNVCYGPSRPSVTFVPTGTQNIKLIIAVVEGQATGYEIKAVAITSAITYTQKGTFLQNETTSIYHFTTVDLPGTCFNFRVVATIGSGKWISSCEPVIEPNVCYGPSRPSVTFVPTGTQNIKLIIAVVEGQATGYEIKAVSITSGITYTQKGTFLQNETTSIYHFTTVDLPGTCFNFRVVATIGSGKWISSSEPVIEPNVCFGLGFFSGDWFEISGCYSLGGTIIKSKAILLANEPGNCLQWCGTSTVALQNSTCLCINDDQNLKRAMDYFCSQNCSGIEQFKCGGLRNDHVSVYKELYLPSAMELKKEWDERSEISAERRSLNGSECMTYSSTANPVFSKFVPDNCTEKHLFYCYSETTFEFQDCYRHTYLNIKKTWYEAMEDCRPLYHLWPAQDVNICTEKYIDEEKFWVAVYRWTKGPSRPSVTFVPTGTQNIKLIIAIVDGQATGYEIKAVSITSGITYTQKGTFLQNETTTIYHFTTTDLPGTCFNFRVVATSGSGKWLSSSEPVIEPNVCYDLGFFSGDWFEISGCYSLRGAIIKNKTSLLANEPGNCLQWCGTKTVALQNSTCLCIIDDQNLKMAMDYFCSQNCSGIEQFKCGGRSNDHVSVYKERSEISAERGSLNGSECLTYSRTANSMFSKFVPENCTEKHPFYCYSETTFEFQNCYRHTYLNIKKTWYEAVEDCRPLYHLWPAEDVDICREKYIHEEKFWVAVYRWTKGPSKPSVTFEPSDTQNIKLRIAIVEGQATGYVIKAESITSGTTYTQKGTFLQHETTSIYHFTTTDIPGTCYNFRVVATSGSGPWASSSDPVIEPNVCYGTITTAEVRSEIQRLRNDGNQLVFLCDFDPSSDPSVLYQVTWYGGVSGSESKLVSSTRTSYLSREQFRSLTYLPEAHITLGMTIFCTISSTKQSIPVPSEPYFVGFEVISKNSVKLEYVEETFIHIRLSVPFGCRSQREECFLAVNMYYMETGADDCLLPAVAAMSNCGVRISSWKWNQTYPIRISLKHGQNLLSVSRMYNIRFRTDETFAHDLFRNYTIPIDIQVQVTTDSADLNGKECHAVCDPHMQTFDGRNYENQKEGTYILYKHLKSPIQVQMRTNPCYGFREGPPFCPCGVAISSGRDVFVVDRCSIPITIYMPQCDDGTLKGKIKSAGNFYQIYLPSGSLVKITSGIAFNIYIYPSISDRMATAGLCGYLDGDVKNEFVLRNGTTVPDYTFDDFNSNWAVKPEEDLFNISNYKSLPSWPREDYLCICKQYQDDNSYQSDKCSPDSRNFCPESDLNDSLAADCSRALIAKSNATIKLDPSDFNVNQIENDTVKEIPKKRNVTEDSANHECWSFLNSSLMFERCSSVPNIDPESFVKTCAMDLMITKTMFWGPTHLDNAQKRCIYQVTVNQPLPEEIIKKYNLTSHSDEHAINRTTSGTDVHTSPSLQELKDLDCPMNCTQQGDCIKGQCRCYKGFGSDDCSVNMNKAPKVYGIPNRGVCDLHETRCDRVFVLGDNFANSRGLSCRLSLFQVKETEIRFHDDSSIIDEAQWISSAEVSCRIVDIRSKRSIQFVDDLDTLAIGYRVAIGNTREIFGRNISLLVVDSLCVDCIKDGFDIRCTLKDGFDLINRRCNKKISAEKKIESGPTVLIISAVVGSVLVVIVAGVVLYYCLVVRTRRAHHENDNRERAYAVVQEMERNTEYYENIDVYDEIQDLPRDYSNTNILVSAPTCDESKHSERNYANLGSTHNNACTSNA